MRRIISIGGRCEKCLEHVELTVMSTMEQYQHWIYYSIGFVCGGIVGWLI